MSDAEMNFRTYVAPDYELRCLDDLPATKIDRSKRIGLPNERYLAPVGKPRIVKPRRRALDFAVGLLLRTPVPTLDRERRSKPTADELAHLERNALAIAKHIGLLHAMLNPDKLAIDYGDYAKDDGESLLEWFQAARRIQAMFRRPARPTEIPVAPAYVYLAFNSDGSRSMAVRPGFTGDALIYHAAQMIAKGTTSQTCEHCGTTFLSGGGRGKDKKRSGSRFCNDECRWNHHNEMRRKTTAQS
jgi:hypothetical protein